MKISYQDFEKEFSDSMVELEEAFQKRNYLKTISYLRFLTRSYYIINYKMADDRLEEITQQISFDFLGETTISNSNPDTVVFYDGFGQIDRVTERNCVNALDKLDYKVVWVVHINAPELEEIQQYCEGKENVSLRIVPKSPVMERMRFFQTIIKEIAPKHLFFLTKPWDICGIGVFSTIKGDVTRYLLDATDHAFWLGKCAVDYIIGGRDWGYNVAKQLRGIRPERYLFLPCYPTSRTQYPYEGMPFDEEKYGFIFSGGAAYKIEGDTAYQEMVEHILTNHPEIKFVFASNGTNSILEYLTEKYPDQFFHIDERRDLDEVLKHAKLYLGTHPITGGLMVQYPIVNHCVPLCLVDEPGSIMMDPRSFLLQPEKVNFVYKSKEALLAELDRFLDDEQYLEQARTKLDGLVISEEEFTEQMQRLLTEHRTKFKGKEMSINLDQFLATYKRRADYKMFCNIIYNSHNDWIKRKYPEIIEEMDAKKRDGTL